MAGELTPCIFCGLPTTWVEAAGGRITPWHVVAEGWGFPHCNKELDNLHALETMI